MLKCIIGTRYTGTNKDRVGNGGMTQTLGNRPPVVCSDKRQLSTDVGCYVVCYDSPVCGRQPLASAACDCTKLINN